MSPVRPLLMRTCNNGCGAYLLIPLCAMLDIVTHCCQTGIVRLLSNIRLRITSNSRVQVTADSRLQADSRQQTADRRNKTDAYTTININLFPTGFHQFNFPYKHKLYFENTVMLFVFFIATQE